MLSSGQNSHWKCQKSVIFNGQLPIENALEAQYGVRRNLYYGSNPGYVVYTIYGAIIGDEALNIK